MKSPVVVYRNQTKIKELLKYDGEVIAYTTINVAPLNFENEAPYEVALIKLSNNNIVYGALVDVALSDLAIGLKVTPVLRRIGEPEEDNVIEYGVKFTSKK